MTDINSVVFSGRLVRDAAASYTPKGMALLKFAVASNAYKGGEYTNFFECVIFGKQAEALGQYLTKGRFVTIMGELRQERWQGQNGNRSKIVVVVNRVVLSGSGKKKEIEDNFKDDIPWEES